MGQVNPTIAMTIGHHSRKAADIMEERGWIRHALENEQGVCLMGAMNRALSPVDHFQRSTLLAAFSMHFGAWMAAHYPTPQVSGGIGAAWWNDTVFESKEETLAWLRKFADDTDPQKP